MTSLPAAPPVEVRRPVWRTVAPFVLALALVAAVFSRVDLAAFARSLRHVRVVPFVLGSACFSVGLLVADAVATVPLYQRLVGPVRYRDFITFRGASYLPSLLNHHLGQAALTWLLAKGCRLPLWRVAGATLLGYASWGGCLLGVGCLALLASHQPIGWLAPPLGAGFAYLGLLAWKPPRLARQATLAPLFEAGVTGHLVALAARVPHMLVMFVGTWASFGLFGVDVPLAMALRYIPLLMIALTLPLTPQGFGTRDAVASLFFVGYAPGRTQAERLAVVVAATTSWGVITTVWEALIGLGFTRRASRVTA
jgi:Lysylphosphatidylglycerol synthase TM region